MSIMRAQEASSSKYRYNYQVFLSFRGEDTRKTFSDHLYEALIKSGVRTFRDDDDIERGKNLELELTKAVQQSRISVIVFSKNFAYSKWCLNEVLMITEWSRSQTSSHEILPIFYDVDPSDVRNQKGSIGEAFIRYEEMLNQSEMGGEEKKEWMGKLQAWKVALREVANIAGMVLQTLAKGHEAKFIQEIIKVVELKLNRTVLHVGRHLVGMQSRVKSIDSWVQNSSSREHILVICGMGGIGKTTVAKFVYNSNSQKFDGSSFLALVREKARQINGLVNLQMQLFFSILKKKQEICNVDEGVIKINEAICCKKVLVVLDDVDEPEQLDALLGMREFYPGSKIIITTRNKSLLKAQEVHKLHLVEKLGFYESLELFNWHAYGNEVPVEGFKELSEGAIYHCGGLPLALKILGSSLAGKSIKVWESTLKKLQAIPEAKILNVLQMSFDSLQDDHDRKLFLHIACFFVGEDKDETIEILDACGFFAACGIENLIDRCLIYIDGKSKIKMHQLVQEMGWQIVDQESPNEPGTRSRLWCFKDSFMVLKERKGTETVEGMVLDMQMYKKDIFNMRRGKKLLHDEFCETFSVSNQGSSFRRRYFNFLSSERATDVGFNFDAFSNMNKLRLLKLNYTKMSGSCENFPGCLRWLCWHGFPFRDIPFDLPLGNLVSLDMSYSNLKHVSFGKKVLLSLKILNLSYSKRIVKTPYFGRLPNLQKLILKGCVSLVEVCDSIGNLEKLALLNLKNCKSLKKYPNIGLLNSLKILIVDGCPNLFGVPLKAEVANVFTVNQSSSDFGAQPKLGHILLQQWMSKSILKNPEHISVSLPRSLVSLSLQNCNLSNDDFPSDLSNLSMVEEIDLSGNRFCTMPRSIGSLTKLQKLNLNSCRELHSISDLPNVFVLNVDYCTTLECITYQSALIRPFIARYGCLKLKEIQGIFKLESVGKVNQETHDSLGLSRLELSRNLMMHYAIRNGSSPTDTEVDENTHQVLYEFGIFSTYLRYEEIPSWCVDGSNKGSSSISFVVPSDPILGIQGLNVYSMYTVSNFKSNVFRTYYLLIAKIENKTKSLCWMYTPMVVAVPGKENEGEQLAWVSHWKFGNDLEIGDELNISVISCFKGLDVKEFGINLVWGEEEMKGAVIGGDLSYYEFTKGVFFLYNMVDLYINPRNCLK